ncbi:hypothetical protein B484DRAFT_218273, partial [Ochromonadaceae sp. CCMP2298]
MGGQKGQGMVVGMGGMVERKFEHSIFCASPSGVLPARSRTRVVFTYQPRKAGLFEFLVYAQVRAVDAQGVRVMISNDEATLLRTGGGEGAGGGGVGSTGMGGNSGGMGSTSMGGNGVGSNGRHLPLMTNITARAAFPKLLFEDVRAGADVQIADVDSLWQRCSLSQLNYDLSIPMTQHEVLLNEASAPSPTDFQTYRFEFCPATLGSPEQ